MTTKKRLYMPELKGMEVEDHVMRLAVLTEQRYSSAWQAGRQDGYEDGWEGGYLQAYIELEQLLEVRTWESFSRHVHKYVDKALKKQGEKALQEQQELVK